MSNKLSSSVPTDREVVLGILNNSEDVLNRLYIGYFPMILQLILNNNGDEDDAKDVYQEAIIILYNKIKSGDFELSSKLKTYIYLLELNCLTYYSLLIHLYVNGNPILDKKKL